MRSRSLLICVVISLLPGGVSAQVQDRALLDVRTVPHFDDGSEVLRQGLEFQQRLEQRGPEAFGLGNVLRTLSYPSGASIATLRGLAFDSLCPQRTRLLPGRSVSRVDVTGRPWFGTPSLAVLLLPRGVYGIGEQELVWFSSGFEPGGTAVLEISIERLDGGTAAATVIEPADGQVTERREMRTRIDLPGAGCWEVTGELEGLSLSFVIQSIAR